MDWEKLEGVEYRSNPTQGINSAHIQVTNTEVVNS
jgi:hypothetical protein